MLYPSRSLSRDPFFRDPFFRDPFAAMRRLQDELDRAFAPQAYAQGHVAAGFPAVNMWQGEHSIALTAELPGFKPEDIDIQVKDDTLTISGERSLPESGDKAAEKVDARFVNGVLEIELVRPEEDRPRRIEVKSA